MMRRGLTLLEMLLAVALLAAVAVACLPVITSSLNLLQQSRGGMDIAQLSTFADQWVAEHEARQAREAAEAAADAEADPQAATGTAGQDLTATFDPGRAPATIGEPAADVPVDVDRLEGGEDADHAWILFRSGESKILRLVPVRPTSVESTLDGADDDGSRATPSEGRRR